MLSSELLLGDELAVGADVGVPQAGIVPQLPQGGGCVGDGIVLPALALADEQQPLLGLLLGAERNRHDEPSKKNRGEPYKFHAVDLPKRHLPTGRPRMQHGVGARLHPGRVPVGRDRQHNAQQREQDRGDQRGREAADRETGEQRRGGFQ